MNTTSDLLPALRTALASGVAPGRALDHLALRHEDSSITIALSEMDRPDLMNVLVEAPESVAGALVTPEAFVESLAFVGAKWADLGAEPDAHAVRTYQDDLEAVLLAVFRPDADGARLRDLCAAFAEVELAADMLVFLAVNRPRGLVALRRDNLSSLDFSTWEFVAHVCHEFRPDLMAEALILAADLHGDDGVQLASDSDAPDSRDRWTANGPEATAFAGEFIAASREWALASQTTRVNEETVTEEYFAL